MLSPWGAESTRSVRDCQLEVRQEYSNDMHAGNSAAGLMVITMLTGHPV